MLMPVTTVVVVMIMIVMIAPVVVATAIGAALGLKRCFDFFKFSSKSMQHLFDHVVGPDVEGVISNLRWKMPISEMPGKPHEVMRIFMTDLDKRFGGGFDLKPSSVIKIRITSCGLPGISEI